jgi:VanZ family protein
MENSNRSKFLKFWFPVIIYSGIIFWVSSLPYVKTPMPKIHFDVILHMLVYMPFGFLLAKAIKNTKNSVSWKSLLGLVLLFSFLYGCSDEFHQSFVPGRSSEVLDLIADTIGGVIGGYVYLWFLRHSENK